jgi:cell division protein FtsL
MTDQVESKEQKASEAQEQPTAAELTINDLNAMKVIIDIASSRGAFKAGEMEAVGKVYNKLSVFLESVTAKKE